MEVEVVLREVGEHRRGDVDPVRAACSSSACEEISIAHATSPRVEHLAERALEVDRLRRRAHDRPLLAADDRLDRAEQPARRARALEQRAGEERGRGLAVGAGDPGDAQRRRRIAVEARRGDAPSPPARRSTTTSGTPSPSGRCTTSAAAPRATASGAKSCPSRVKPGTQKNRVPGATSRLSKVRPVTTTSGPSPSNSRSVMRPGSLRTRPAARMSCHRRIARPPHAHRRRRHR